MKWGYIIGILGDLRGPRIRVGEMENGSIELERGKKIILTFGEHRGDAGQDCCQFQRAPP